MNRQQRRKAEKNKISGQALQKKLIYAINLHQENKLQEAKIQYSKLFKIIPKNYDLIRHMGILYQDLGDMENAYGYFKKALQINPQGYEAISNLGTIHAINKNDPLAIKCFEKSLSIKQDYIPAVNNLAGIHHRLHNSINAMKYAEQALALQPKNILTINQYAKALIINNRIEEGIKYFEDLCNNNPDRFDFKSNLASALKEIGDFKKSKEIIDEGFNKNFKRLDFFAPFASDKENTLSDNQISYFEEQLEEKSLQKDDKILISLAFFNYFRNKKDFSKSGKYLKFANDLQYSLKKFNIEKDQKLFERVKLLFENNEKFPVKKANSEVKPIFICGMPRSGTTLCEQILSSHSKIKGAGELTHLLQLTGLENIIQPEDDKIDLFENNIKDTKFLIKIRENYMAALEEINDKKAAYVTDKLPHNFVFIGLIKLIFPEAKIIYCKRDPIDNCFSLYTHKFVDMSHQYSYNQEMLGAYYLLHEKLMEHWLSKYKDEIYILDNEQLVAEQETISKDIINFCDLEWEEQCLDFYKTRRQVRTASIEQVRQPMNKKSIGAWKNYEDYLGELVSSLK